MYNVDSCFFCPANIIIRITVIGCFVFKSCAVEISFGTIMTNFWCHTLDGWLFSFDTVSISLFLRNPQSHESQSKVALYLLKQETNIPFNHYEFIASDYCILLMPEAFCCKLNLEVNEFRLYSNNTKSSLLSRSQLVFKWSQWWCYTAGLDPSWSSTRPFHYWLQLPKTGTTWWNLLCQVCRDLDFHRLTQR